MTTLLMKLTRLPWLVQLQARLVSLKLTSLKLSSLKPSNLNLSSLKLSGPRLVTKLLILMSSALVIIPWVSYIYLGEMEEFLVDSQANAQMLTAEGISTLLHGRSDIFYELPLTLDGYKQLYAHPLPNPIRLDGKSNDWEDLLEDNIGFGNLEGSNAEGAEDSDTQKMFHLTLGEHNDQIYALVTVRDNTLVFRDRNILRLDRSDHLRITYTGQDETIKKMVVTMTEPGVTSTYLIDNDWRYAVHGEPENRIRGTMVESLDGYVVEFRIPLDLLGSTRQFGLAVVDVDDPDTRELVSVTGTLPSAGQEDFGLVLLKSPEVLRIIDGLGYSGAKIQVIDSRKRIRAEVGSREQNKLPGTQADTSWWVFWDALSSYITDPLYRLIETNLRAGAHIVSDDVLNQALAGEPSFQRQISDEGGEAIVAAHPIFVQDSILGAVLLQQDTNRILELRRDALKRIVNFSVIFLFILLALILVFSMRLAGRIRKLGAEATGAIDSAGRLKTNQIKAETSAGDEIGDLARSISGMLARLHQHNQFLEKMPLTLRHEINNPLNTLSTSLQNLEFEDTASGRSKYLEAARRGLNRIGMIVQNLADAASLEDALHSEEPDIIDLNELLQNYMSNAGSNHPGHHFKYHGTAAFCEVADYRIEQLLDKLIDNAVDFSSPDSVIHAKLEKHQGQLNLEVSNQGPTVDDSKLVHIFDSMVSIRDARDDSRLHFGMGLYVVRIIAEHHGGSVSAANLADQSGFAVTVTFPLVSPKLSQKEGNLERAEAFAAS